MKITRLVEPYVARHNLIRAEYTCPTHRSDSCARPWINTREKRLILAPVIKFAIRGNRQGPVLVLGQISYAAQLFS